MDLTDADVEPKRRKELQRFFVSKAGQPVNVSGSKNGLLVQNAGAALSSSFAEIHYRPRMMIMPFETQRIKSSCDTRASITIFPPCSSITWVVFSGILFVRTPMSKELLLSQGGEREKNKEKEKTKQKKKHQLV